MECDFDITTLNDYLKKIKRIIYYDKDFNFFGMTLVKKIKIDDLLCCIYAILPSCYKKALKRKDYEKLYSIVSYKNLEIALKQKFIFNSNLYIINNNNIDQLINIISKNIVKDINFIEKDSMH